MKALPLASLSAPAGRSPSPLGTLLGSIYNALTRENTLRRLEDLDDRLLRDVGLSRSEVERARRRAW